MGYTSSATNFEVQYSLGEDWKIEILGLSEVKKKGNGIKKLQDGYTLRYSGVGMDRRAKEGVGIITSEQLETRVSRWEPLNSRILVIDLDLEINLSLIQIYAPKDYSDILDKEEFYVQLQNVMNRGISKGRRILLSQGSSTF